MKLAVIIPKDNKFNIVLELPHRKLMAKIKEKLGPQGVSAFNEIAKEFKRETIKLP